MFMHNKKFCKNVKDAELRRINLQSVFYGNKFCFPCNFSFSCVHNLINSNWKVIMNVEMSRVLQ